MLINPSSLDGTFARKDFHAYTGMEPQLFKETILKNFDFIENYMLKTIIHAQTIQQRLDDKELQIQECTVQEVKASDAISEGKAKECYMSIDERAQHTREYDSWVNERQMQTTEENVDMSKVLDASLLTQKAVGHNQKSTIQAAEQGMMHMLMM
nr:hypothetical protein [Tanacetum cinerariifolium]